MNTKPAKIDMKKIFLNTLFWGFILWLIGYVLGIVFFAFVPKESIGWYILPFGVIATLWVLFKKIERESFGCYLPAGCRMHPPSVQEDELSVI